MSMAKYFKCRSIEDLIEEAKKSRALTRSLGAFQLIMLGIGAIIGAGIFVFTGTAAGGFAGPAITLSFMLAGFACACAALCYAELSSMIPIAGSAYTYAYTTLGELPAWLIFSLALLTYCLGAASVASGWSGYMQSFLGDYGITIPLIFSDSFGTMLTAADGTQVMALIDLPAILISLFVMCIVYFGSEASAWVNTIIVFIKMTVLLLFVAIGSTKINPENWVPFIPENTGTFGEFGYSGIVSGAAIVFLAYTGFDAVATAAQETKNPKRDLPIGIIGSLLVCVLVYVLVSGVLTGIVPYTQLNVAEPMAIAVDVIGMPWFSVAVKIGAIAGLTTVILVLTYGAVRIMYTVAHDGLLPKQLAKTNKKYHTPHYLTLIMGCTVAVLSSLLPVDKLVLLANFGTLVTFTIVCVGTIYLRVKKPNIQREFRCPWVPVVPGVGILLFMTILGSIPAIIFLYAAIWLSFMLFVYFMYGAKNSHLLNPQTK